MSQLQSVSWNDAHFCGLRCQTNVYSLSKLTSRDNRTKFLAASLDGHLASVEFEYQPDCGKNLPKPKYDVLFNSVLNANIDSENEGEMETEIVSLDIVCDLEHLEGNILAVSYLKLRQYDEDKAPQAFMNVYHLSEESEDNQLNASKSLLQKLNLEFIPFKLTHHRILQKDGNLDIYFLLSGNDHKIHTYRLVGNFKGLEEVDTVKHFPEFSSIEDNVTQLEIKQIDDVHRLTSFGTQNGLICLFLINTESKEVVSCWTSEMDSPITSLHFFYQHTDIQCPDFLKTKDSVCQHEEEEEKQALNLLVTSAVDPASIYQDVFANGLGKCRTLPVSNSQDVVLCSCVMDVDFDGENEILIGTYGQVLLVYKLAHEKPQVYTSTPFHSPLPVPIHSDTPILSTEGDNGKQEEKESQDKDVRRRHKSMVTAGSVTTESETAHSDKHAKHKSEDGIHLEGTHQALMSRVFRSQENLASSSSKSIHFETPDQPLTPDITIPHFAMAPVTEFPCYKLAWTRRFCNPVMGLMCDDVTGDGMLDLVVLTLKGLHVLQPDLQAVTTVLMNRLQQLCMSDNEIGPQQAETESESHNQS